MRNIRKEVSMEDLPKKETASGELRKQDKLVFVWWLLFWLFGLLFYYKQKTLWVSALYFSGTLTSFCLQVPDIDGHWAERPVTCHQKKTIHEQLFPSSQKETYDSEKICKTENDGVQTKFPWGILASLTSKNWVRLSQAGRNDLRTRQKGIWIFKKKKRKKSVLSSWVVRKPELWAQGKWK